jgi:OTT_1508-like deaminase
LIANLAEKIFDSEDWSLENFETLKKNIEDYLQDLPSQNNRFRNFLIKVMIFLQDSENLFEIIKESKEENENENKEAIVKSLLRKKRWFERARIITTENNALISKTLHCECRILKHIFNKFSDGSLDVKSWKKFVDAFLEKRIAVSKPCCFYCHLLFLR